MKALLRILLCILVMSSLCFADTALREKMNIEKIIWTVSDVYPPYIFNFSDKNQGFAIDVMREIFTPLGYSVDYQTVGWDRAIQMVARGYADCLPGAYAEHAKYMNVPIPKTAVGKMRIHFFCKKNSWVDKNWEYDGTEKTLSQVKIGVMAGASYGSELDPYLKQADKFMVQENYGAYATRNNILKVLSGRIDVMIEDYQAVMHELKRMKLLEMIVSAGHEKNPGTPYYIFFSKKSPFYSKYTSLLETNLPKFKQSSKFKNLQERYFK
jgi:polar amino acid transport system substrate-binding protein